MRSSPNSLNNISSRERSETGASKFLILNRKNIRMFITLDVRIYFKKEIINLVNLQTNNIS